MNKHLLNLLALGVFSHAAVCVAMDGVAALLEKSTAELKAAVALTGAVLSDERAAVRLYIKIRELFEDISFCRQAMERQRKVADAHHWSNDAELKDRVQHAIDALLAAEKRMASYRKNGVVAVNFADIMGLMGADFVFKERFCFGGCGSLTLSGERADLFRTALTFVGCRRSVKHIIVYDAVVFGSEEELIASLGHELAHLGHVRLKDASRAKLFFQEVDADIRSICFQADDGIWRLKPDHRDLCDRLAAGFYSFDRLHDPLVVLTPDEMLKLKHFFSRFRLKTRSLYYETAPFRAQYLREFADIMISDFGGQMTDEQFQLVIGVGAIIDAMHYKIELGDGSAGLIAHARRDARVAASMNIPDIEGYRATFDRMLPPYDGEVEDAPKPSWRRTAPPAAS